MLLLTILLNDMLRNNAFYSDQNNTLVIIQNLCDIINWNSKHYQLESGSFCMLHIYFNCNKSTRKRAELCSVLAFTKPYYRCTVRKYHNPACEQHTTLFDACDTSSNTAVVADLPRCSGIKYLGGISSTAFRYQPLNVSALSPEHCDRSILGNT